MSDTNNVPMQFKITDEADKLYLKLGKEKGLARARELSDDYLGYIMNMDKYNYDPVKIDKWRNERMFWNAVGNEISKNYD